jgi:hypothetical protein
MIPVHDQIDLGSLIKEVRMRVPRHEAAVADTRLRNLLQSMIALIYEEPHTLEHRVLASMLMAIANEPAVRFRFRRWEITALGSSALVLLAAFFTDLINGRYDATSVRTVVLTLGLQALPQPNE